MEKYIDWRRLSAAASLGVLSLLHPSAAALAADVSAPATTVPDVVVEGDRLRAPSTTVATPDDPHRLPARDVGEFLRSLPGVSASRMGGHGLDPVIRGQRANQINIIDDGATTFGGCPNRMDPPTSVMALETADRITVTRGYQSVLNGPGGSGGTVRLHRDPPRLTVAKPYRLTTGGGYETNGAVRDGFIDGAAGLPEGYARASGHWKQAGNYQDGQGLKVRSASSQFGGAAEAGWTPENALVSLGYSFNKTEDALFAGATMDAPLDRTDTVRLKAERTDLDAGALTGVRLEAYASLVEHTMDNFSLRPNTGTRTEVDSTSDTYGGTAIADLRVGAMEASVGADLQANTRDAKRYMGTSPTDLVSAGNLESVMWPDLTIVQVGLFGEGKVPVATAGALTVGLRYDFVAADSAAADATTVRNGGGTANALYRQYYGRSAGTETEHNVGALARYEHALTETTTGFAGLSRSVRTADATERGMAAKAMGTGRAWVGNPGLDPEQHHQVDVGVTTETTAWALGGTVYYDHVRDFILRDSARGQAGILRSDRATIYRNVDAGLAGVDVSGRYGFADHWSLSADAAYTYGEDTDTDRALAQIPPLSGSVQATYEPDPWSVGLRMRWAATQTRVDDDLASGSAQDVGKTSGFAVFDLLGSYEILEGVRVDAGVTNLFDHSYANHLNRSSAFDPTVTQVNEPGRSVFFRGRLSL